MPVCVVPLSFLSTWVTIYSRTRVWDFTLLEEDWWQNFMCTGFSISTGCCNNSASPHVSITLYASCLYLALQPSTASLSETTFYSFTRAQHMWINKYSVFFPTGTLDVCLLFEQRRQKVIFRTVWICCECREWLICSHVVGLKFISCHVSFYILKHCVRLKGALI